MTSDSCQERLDRALLGLKSRSRQAVSRAIAELEAISNDCAGTQVAAAARRAIVDQARPRMGPKSDPMSESEEEVLRYVDGASRLESPRLRQIGALVPAVPTASFPDRLNQSLAALLGRLGSRAVKDIDVAVTVLRTVEQIAVLPLYRERMSGIARRLRQLVEAAQAGEVLQQFETRLACSDIEGAIDIAQRHATVLPQLLTRLPELEMARRVGQAVLGLDEKSRGEIEWHEVQSDWDALVGRVRGLEPLSGQRDRWLQTLRGVRHRLDERLAEQIRAAQDGEVLAALMQRSLVGHRRDESELPAQLTIALSDAVGRVVAAAVSESELLSFRDRLSALTATSDGSCLLWLSETLNRTDRLCAQWRGLSRGERGDTVDKAGWPAAMVRDASEVAALVGEYEQLLTQANLGICEPTSLEGLLSQVAHLPQLQSQIRALPAIADDACLRIRIGDAFRMERWEEFHTILREASSAGSAAVIAESGWQIVADHLQTIKDVAALARTRNWRNAEDLIQWWRSWHGFRDVLVAGGVLAAAPMVSGWLEERLTGVEKDTERVLSDALVSEAASRLDRWCDDLHKLAGDRAFVKRFSERIALRSLLDSARAEGALEFARALIANSMELTRLGSVSAPPPVLEAIAALWREPDPPVTLIRTLCDFPGLTEHPTLSSALARERLFTSVADRGVTGPELAVRFESIGRSADAATKRNWPARLDKLSRGWTTATDLAKGVFAAFLAAALTGARAKVDLHRQVLQQHHDTILRDVEDVWRRLMAGAVQTAAEELQRRITDLVHVHEEIGRISEIFGNVYCDLPTPDQVRLIADLLGEMRAYSQARGSLRDATTLAALRSCEERLTEAARAMKPLRAQLGIDATLSVPSTVELLDYVASLGASFNFLSDFERSVAMSEALPVDERYMQWSALIDKARALSRHWEGIELSQSTGLAQSVLGLMWDALETSLGDALPRPNALDCRVLESRIAALHEAEEAALALRAYARDQVISPYTAGNPRAVDGFLELLPESPLAGRRAGRCLDVVLDTKDVRTLLEAIRDRLPGWVQRRHGWRL